MTYRCSFCGAETEVTQFNESVVGRRQGSEFVMLEDIGRDALDLLCNPCNESECCDAPVFSGEMSEELKSYIVSALDAEIAMIDSFPMFVRDEYSKRRKSLSDRRDELNENKVLYTPSLS